MSVIEHQLLRITGFCFLLCVSNTVPCSADPVYPPVKLIHFEGDPPFTPKPVTLQGYLRQPEGGGRHSAIVLLHSCEASAAERLDQNWGAKIASWGYVTLTIDSFGPRGIGNICGSRYPRDLDYDAYRGLNFLVRQPFVDAKRVVVLGFSQGGSLALLSVERGAIEQTYENKFRAAVAFYPICEALSGITNVPTLILIGELDEWTPGCRAMANGRDDWDKSRKTGSAVRLLVYPDAYYGFDVPRFKTRAKYGGKYVEFNQLAADQSTDDLREFLKATFGGSQ